MLLRRILLTVKPVQAINLACDSEGSAPLVDYFRRLACSWTAAERTSRGTVLFDNQFLRFNAPSNEARRLADQRRDSPWRTASSILETDKCVFSVSPAAAPL